MADQRWVVGVNEQYDWNGPEETFTEHQTTAEVGALLAKWIGAPVARQYDIFPCHCPVCDPALPALPYRGDRCTCGGELVAEGITEVCRTCGKVYDSVPF